MYPNNVHNYFPRLFFAFLEVLSNFWKLMYSIHIENIYCLWLLLLLLFFGRNDTCWEFPIKTRNSEQNHKRPKSSLLFCSGTSSASKKQRQFSTTISIIQEKYHNTIVKHDSTRWYKIIQRQYNGSKSGPRPDILTALLKSQGGLWETMDTRSSKCPREGDFVKMSTSWSWDQ